MKRVPLTVYDVQHRGGKGKMGMAALEESQDVFQDIFITRNHDELLFFTNTGRIFSFLSIRCLKGLVLQKVVR